MKYLYVVGAFLIALPIIGFVTCIRNYRKTDSDSIKSLFLSSCGLLAGGILILVGCGSLLKECSGCGQCYVKLNMPNYCDECGYALTEDAVKRFDCSCGAVYYSDSGEKFCTDCGAKIDYAANTNPTEETVKKFECECGMVYHADGGEKFCKDCGTEIVYGEE